MEDSLSSPPRPRRTLRLASDGTMSFSPLVIPPPCFASQLPRGCPLTLPETPKSAHGASPETFMVRLPRNQMDIYSASDLVQTPSPDLQRETSSPWKQNSDQNLTEVVSEVTRLQEGQNVELARQRALLKHFEEQLKTETERADSTQEEVARVTRRICLAQDESTRKKVSCDALQREVHSLVSEGLELMMQMESERNQQQNAKRKHGELRERMAAHRLLVEQHERTEPLRQELARQQSRIAALTAQKHELETNPTEADALTSGKRQAQVLQELDRLRSEKQRLEQGVVLKLGQVNREQERQMQLRQDMEVLRKRNRAQLTRLRRCVDETERRNEQWNQEASRLEEATAQLQREVDGTQPEDATAQMRGEKGKGK
ncbi:apical junction molecule-like isoform X2 [Branchiostoma floridae]|uniref:Apical junction molecule-like isoform X2 n=1 Tax=Branchiostoma floridae TaxID=7739 RepID=A0A9J7MGR9_BRAFL|nr:apical junction molecule-like isoform X2 [Branchiostoma floridae]